MIVRNAMGHDNPVAATLADANEAGHAGSIRGSDEREIVHVSAVPDFQAAASCVPPRGMERRTAKGSGESRNSRKR